MSAGKPAGMARVELWPEVTAVEVALMGPNSSRRRLPRYAARMGSRSRSNPAIVLIGNPTAQNPFIVETPFGALAVGRRDGFQKGQLVADWLVDDAAAPLCTCDDDAALEHATRLRDYFAGNLRALDTLPVGEGTLFQRRVWSAARRIPPGETRTYLWIAQQLDEGHALCRAVGQALRRNPLPVVVPCHRVVGASGIGGYAGKQDGVLAAIKLGLLQFEARLVGGLLDCAPPRQPGT